MTNINLLNELTTKDREILERYIYLNGIKHNFIGLDRYLEHWAKNNVKLYKLFGNSLTWSTSVSFKVPQD